MTRNDFDEKLKIFLAGCEKISERKLEIQDLKKYIRFSADLRSFCFVEKSSGDVLKAANWNRPARHARGNIFDAHNGLENITPYGLALLKTGRKPRS